MNIQTERLENHTARLTVEVDVAVWENAKQKAARQLSKRYRIPGFRPGKAPYRIISNFVGESAIIEDAMETLGNNVYRDALSETDLRPYTSGSLEDFKLDPPTYIFTVPLEPEVQLNDYRSIRKDFEAPVITDEDVDRSMLELQQQEAESEEVEGPVEMGQRITVDVHSEFIDGPVNPALEEAISEAEDAEAAEEATEEASADEAASDESEEAVTGPYVGDPFIHEHDAVYVLDAENEPVLPGFNAAMTGAVVGEPVEFELTVPDTDESGAAGRKVHFSITVKKLESITLLPLDDEFAAKVSAEEETPLNLEQLRERIRANLEESALRTANEAYANQVLDDIVAQASISFAEATVAERIEDMLKDLDQTLRRQGISLEDYMKITNTTKEMLYEQYQPSAEENLRRSLTLSELVMRENVMITTEMIDTEIESMIAQFGAQGEMFRSFLDTPQQRQSMANNLLYREALEVLGQIGRGEEVRPRSFALAAEDAEAEAVVAEAVAAATEAEEDAPAEAEAEVAAPEAEVSAVEDDQVVEKEDKSRDD